MADPERVLDPLEDEPDVQPSTPLDEEPSDRHVGPIDHSEDILFLRDDDPRLKRLAGEPEEG